MVERTLETFFTLLVAALLACAELVELFEPRPPAPNWRYRAYRAALRASARVHR
jgi:hypothetical protein